MPVILGSEFEELEEPVPSSTDLLQLQVLNAIEGLRQAIERMPTPLVEVQEPDLAEIVTAVNGIKTQTVTASEIAKAIKDALQPVQPSGDGETNQTLKQVAEALEKLDFRLKGVGTQAYGGGTVHLAKGTELTATIVGYATESTQALIENHTNQTNLSQNPLAKYRIADLNSGTTAYYGFTSTSGKWVILKEDKSANPNTYRYANGASDYPTNWGNRATLTYQYLHQLTGL